MSLQLMALECYIPGRREDVGQDLTLTLDYPNTHARDIVDESDENFGELIYTMKEVHMRYGPASNTLFTIIPVWRHQSNTHSTTVT
jgi:hypothetical protein